MRRDVKYELSIFGNFRGITPDPSTISKMMESLKEYDMVPSVYEEGSVNFSPSNPEDIQSESVDRLAMISNSNKINISFGLNRIDVAKDALTFDNSLSSTEFFSLIDILKKSIEDLPFSRIAVNTTTFFDEPESDKIIQHSKSKISFYDDFDESLLRINKKMDLTVNGESEETNIILTSQNAPGIIKYNEKPISFDKGWMIHFDINTVPQNIRERFSVNEINEFVLTTSALREEIIKDLLA